MAGLASTSPTAGDDTATRLNPYLAFDGDAEQLRGWWARLSDGGTVTMPLELQQWGNDFGMCMDRFGTPWMVNIAGQPG